MPSDIVEMAKRTFFVHGVVAILPAVLATLLVYYTVTPNQTPPYVACLANVLLFAGVVASVDAGFLVVSESGWRRHYPRSRDEETAELHAAVAILINIIAVFLAIALTRYSGGLAFWNWG
jgi:hypothetical protein